MRKNYERGFTLIELLIVIAIIAVLAAVVFVALNPGQRFIDARDARRHTDVENVAAALKTYQVDNDGDYPATVAALTAGSFYTIGTDATGCNTGCTAQTTQAACADLAALVTGGYLGSVPMDPSGGTAAKTDYYVSRNSTGTVEVGACDPEGGSAITVTR
ncbi:MAG: prepilin-type N-terminal cleavage/methylation domain-containing protein [Candidatus Uhrbacteria bacterium]